MKPVAANRLVSILRTLIPLSHHIPELGVSVPIPLTTANVECGSHAIAAALTLAILRVPVRVARGMATVVSTDVVTPNLKHYFVVRGSDDAVFDSSLTLPIPPVNLGPPIAGVAFGQSTTTPSLRVVHRRDQLSKSELDAIFAARSNPVAVYVEESSWRPEELIEMKTAAPFGKWIDSTFGSHVGIWPRIAWVLAAEANSDRDIQDLTQAELAEKISGMSSDVIHKVRTICKKLQ